MERGKRKIITLHPSIDVKRKYIRGAIKGRNIKVRG